MRSDFKSVSCFPGVSSTCYGGRVWFWWCQVTLVSVASVLILASCHLIISSACCPQYIWLEPALPKLPIDSGLLRVQLSLWSFACELLWTWDSGCVRVLGSQASFETLRSWCDQAVILGSWNPKVLGMLQYLKMVYLLRTGGLFGVFETKVYQHQSEGTQAAGQAGPPYSCFCYHRPVTIDLEQMFCSTHQWS